MIIHKKTNSSQDIDNLNQNIERFNNEINNTVENAKNKFDTIINASIDEFHYRLQQKLDSIAKAIHKKNKDILISELTSKILEADSLDFLNQKGKTLTRQVIIKLLKNSIIQ